MALTPSKDVMKILDTWYEGPPIETDRVQQIIINETKLIYNKVQQHDSMLFSVTIDEFLLSSLCVWWVAGLARFLG